MGLRRQPPPAPRESFLDVPNPERVLDGNPPPLALSALPDAAAGCLRGRRLLAGRQAARSAPQRRGHLADVGARGVRPVPAILGADLDRSFVYFLQMGPMVRA